MKKDCKRETERQIESERTKENDCRVEESHFLPFSPIFGKIKKKRITDGQTQTNGPMVIPLIEKTRPDTLHKMFAVFLKGFT